MWSDPEEDISDTEEDVEDFVKRFREVMAELNKEEEEERLARKEKKKGSKGKTLPCPSSSSSEPSSPAYSNSGSKTTTTDSVETIEIDENFVDEDDELTELEDDSSAPGNCPQRPVRLRRAPVRFENYVSSAGAGSSELKSQPKPDAKASGVKLASNSSPQPHSSSRGDGSDPNWSNFMKDLESAKVCVERIDNPGTVDAADERKELQSDSCLQM